MPLLLDVQAPPSARCPRWRGYLTGRSRALGEGTVSAVLDPVLNGPVDRFVAELAPEVARISPRILDSDLSLEAYNLVAAFIDVDGHHSEDELWAFITTFAPRFETQLQRATPGDVRRAGLVAGKASWLEKPSVLFEILVRDDAATGSSVSTRYRDLAMDLARAVCAIDTMPSPVKLVALDQFRTRLQKAMDDAGVGTARAATPEAAATAATQAPPPAEPEKPARPLAEVMAELDALIGLKDVKAEVRRVTDLIQVENLRKER